MGEGPSRGKLLTSGQQSIDREERGKGQWDKVPFKGMMPVTHLLQPCPICLPLPANQSIQPRMDQLG